MQAEQRMPAVAARIEALAAYFAAVPDADVRQKAQELVTLIMELYGAGLATIVRVLQSEENGDGRGMLDALVRDELVASLLVLHDLHPDDSAARIGSALERVRAVAGAEVTLVRVSDATAHVHVRAQRRGSAHSALELRRLIEEVVQAAAPEVDCVAIDGLVEAEPPALVQLTRAPSSRRGTA